jgi:hypothetical protein
MIRHYHERTEIDSLLPNSEDEDRACRFIQNGLLWAQRLRNEEGGWRVTQPMPAKVPGVRV